MSLILICMYNPTMPNSANRYSWDNRRIPIIGNILFRSSYSTILIVVPLWLFECMDLQYPIQLTVSPEKKKSGNTHVRYTVKQFMNDEWEHWRTVLGIWLRWCYVNGCLVVFPLVWQIHVILTTTGSSKACWLLDSLEIFSLHLQS